MYVTKANNSNCHKLYFVKDYDEAIYFKFCVNMSVWCLVAMSNKLLCHPVNLDTIELFDAHSHRRT